MNKNLLNKVDEFAEWSLQTPGACLGGRALATDDPDRLGWDVIQHHLLQDGIFVFRHMPNEARDAIAARLSSWGFALSSWRVFSATAEDIASSRSIQPAPEVFDLKTEFKTNARTVSDVTDFLLSHGMMPFSPGCLSGATSPTALVTARDNTGALRAVSYGHLCFNQHSRWYGMAWCGLVAVDEEARGCGLGRAVNDAAIDAMITHHNAKGVVEYAAESNIPSRRMIEGSGLSLRGDILTLASTKGGVPYTR